MRKFLISVLFLFYNFILQFVYANSLNVDFFTRFNDKWLENYIQEALENNHDLKKTTHILEQYRQEIKTQFSKELPKLSVSSNYLGAHFPKSDGNSFLLKKNSFVLPFRASYEPDFLLKNRDKTRSQKKLYEAQIANQKSTYISLLGDVASTYMNILLFDFLIDRQLEIVKEKAKNTEYNVKKFKFGAIDFFELNDKKEQLETQKIIYENLIKNQKTNLYNFSLLIGRSAYDTENIKRGNLQNFEYSETIPEIISSDLIYSRPDIEEIENQLKSAKINITIAKKEFFPSFNITGFLAFDTAGGGNFFSWDSSFAYLIAGLTQDIFKGGEKIANLKIKKAKFLELLEEYKQRDLNAIKEINNSLNLIKQDTINENNYKIQLNYEEANFLASSKKLKSGVVSKIDYIDDKISYLQAQQLLANSKITRLIDYITLYKALGGQL